MTGKRQAVEVIVKCFKLVKTIFMYMERLASV